MIMLEKEPATTQASSQPKRFLFAQWDGGGNVPPVVSIARRLTARGHAVHVLSDPCNRHEFEASGATFSAWKRAPVRRDHSPQSDPIRDWEISSPLALLARLRDRALFGPALAYAQDLLDELEGRGADALVTNDTLFGAMMAGERAGIPTIALSPNIYLYPLPGMPPFGPGLLPATGILGRLRDHLITSLTRHILGKASATYNQARATLGLPPLAHPLDQLARLDRHLILTSRAFDFAPSHLPAGILYTGPELSDPHFAAPWSGPNFDNRPLVLAGFSTTFQNHAEVLRRVIQALGTLPVNAVLTVGPALNLADFPAPPNVHVCASAPHSVLLKDASAVVTHCGHGTVIRSLAAGVPMLCMPMGRDQNDNATRVVARGAGLLLKPTAEAEAIRNSISQLLQTPSFRSQAQQLGQRIAADAAASPTVAILEERASQPVLHRPRT